ncbi:hypothetical protein [Candidatus Uabimicrobium sp. HlEnr_7]|uniref:hypothetical protein n=1 Tax=Candidatus Uabimicrobium helgolandensis TaxID=3095367 RepID=UPI0035569757
MSTVQYPWEKDKRMKIQGLFLQELLQQHMAKTIRIETFIHGKFFQKVDVKSLLKAFFMFLIGMPLLLVTGVLAFTFGWIYVLYLLISEWKRARELEIITKWTKPLGAISCITLIVPACTVLTRVLRMFPKVYFFVYPYYTVVKTIDEYIIVGWNMYPGLLPCYGPIRDCFPVSTAKITKLPNKLTEPDTKIEHNGNCYEMITFGIGLKGAALENFKMFFVNSNTTELQANKM